MTATASPRVLRLVFADDDSLVLGAVSQLLGQLEDFDVVASVSSGYDAIRAVDIHEPELALIDVDMPGIDGIATAAEIKKRHPDTVVVMFTAFRHESTLAKAMKEVDIAGFLTKDLLIPELAAKLREAAAGKKVFSERPIELMTRSFLAASDNTEQYRDFLDAIDALPDTHQQVFLGLAQAMSTRRIARDTGLSEATVRTYASQIFQRLGVSSKAELAITAVRAGVPLPKPGQGLA